MNRKPNAAPATRAALTTMTAFSTLSLASMSALALDVNLSQYTLSARYALPEPTRTFAAATASNGSGSTLNSTNLFDPALAGVLDFADVFALSGVAGISSGDQSHSLILSQESGRIVEVDRLGNIYSTLTIPLLPGVAGNLNVADQQHEGITMDDAGYLYTVAENGGGDINHPELWVYTPAAAVPEAQTSTQLPAWACWRSAHADAAVPEPGGRARCRFQGCSRLCNCPANSPATSSQPTATPRLCRSTVCRPA